MSLESVKKFMTDRGRAADVIETAESSATVALAAAALGTQPERIAKTLAFRTTEPDSCVLVVMAGDARVDNAAFKAHFGHKASMLKSDEVEPLTGHPVGGVCPFANPDGATVYLDTSLQRFPTVFPACGSASSAIELSCAELEDLSGATGWVTVSRT